MAGKSKRRGHVSPQTQSTSRMDTKPEDPVALHGMMDSPLRGHLGLKSSPFAPTDCKLINQFMVVDHMSAHNRKVTTAKACVDTSAPKAWMVSQKVRDHQRRDAMKQEMKRRQNWLETNTPRLSSRASSEADRKEIFAMMESLNIDEDYLDDLDGRANSIAAHPSNSSGTDGQPRPLNEKELRLVEKMIHDDKNAPSYYHNPKRHPSNIPRTNGASHLVRSSDWGQPTRKSHTSPIRTYPATARTSNGNDCQPDMYDKLKMYLNKQPKNNYGGDLLKTRSKCFTEEKPFQPRTLKYKNASSKISQSKNYNPPKKRQPLEDGEDSDNKSQNSRGHKNEYNKTKVNGVPKRGTITNRPETPMTMTGSVDWMNETLMSRDEPHQRSPSGVPPLDISLDADNLHWLMEQKEKAELRASYSSLAPSYRGEHDGGVNRTAQVTSHTTRETNRAFPLNGSAQATGEDELQYLEFIQEVTNDVLDRGIFTNRVLKQVFESHIDKRKRTLKESKMREMLEVLRHDLGIPVNERSEQESLGHLSNRPWVPDDTLAANETLQDKSLVPADQEAHTPQRRRPRDPYSGGERHLPTLRASPHKRGDRPPRPHSRGGASNLSRPGSACSSLMTTEIREEDEEHNRMINNHRKTGDINQSHHQVDILMIDHEDEYDTMDPNSTLKETDSISLSETSSFDNGPESVDDTDAKLHLTSVSTLPSTSVDSVFTSTQVATNSAPSHYDQTNQPELEGTYELQTKKMLSDTSDHDQSDHGEYDYLSGTDAHSNHSGYGQIGRHQAGNDGGYGGHQAGNDGEYGQIGRHQAGNDKSGYSHSDLGISEQAGSEHTLSNYALSDHALSEHTLSDHAHSDHAHSDHAHSDHALSDHVHIDHALSDHALSVHAISEHNLSEHTLSDHALSEHTLSAPALSEHALSQHTLSEHALSEHALSTHSLPGPSLSEHTPSERTLSDHAQSEHAPTEYAQSDVAQSQYPLSNHDQSEQASSKPAASGHGVYEHSYSVNFQSEGSSDIFPDDDSEVDDQEMTAMYKTALIDDCVQGSAGSADNNSEKHYLVEKDKQEIKKSLTPKPAPRRTNINSTPAETPRSMDRTQTSESVEVSELDDDEVDDF